MIHYKYGFFKEYHFINFKDELLLVYPFFELFLHHN